jgi:hypothetical protein
LVDPIEGFMTDHFVHERNLKRQLSTATLATLIVVGLAPFIRAQSAASTKPQFEVASVKDLQATGGRSGNQRWWQRPRQSESDSRLAANGVGPNSIAGHIFSDLGLLNAMAALVRDQNNSSVLGTSRHGKAFRRAAG